MKKTLLFSSATLTVLALFFARGTFALTFPKINVDRTPSIIITTTVTPSPTPTTILIKTKANIQLRTTLKKTNVLKEIDRRLTSFNKLLEKLAGIDKITETQKQVLEAQIKIEIGKLEELKTKIDVETDATALQDLKKTIFDSYKSFALYLPKIEIVAHADRIIAIADEMTKKTTDTDLLKKISDAKTKAEVATSVVLPLLPEQYPDYKVDLKESRDQLSEARLLLNSVYPQLKPEPTVTK